MLGILGIIDVQVGSGAYVTGIPQTEPPQQLNQLQEEASPLDLFEVRQAIETLSAAKAAQNASDADIERIRNIVVSMENDLEEEVVLRSRC